MIAARLAWSADEGVRYRASSGGFCKSFLWGLVNEGLVDCAVVSRLRDPRRPETIATAEHDEIVDEVTNSIYHAMTDVVAAIPEDRSSAVVALPCQAVEIRRRQAEGGLPGVRVVVELMCNEVRDFAWIEAACKSLGVEDLDRLMYLRFRGDGWPGTTVIETGTTTCISFAELWARWRGQPRPACRVCQLVATAGDVVVGDPWGVVTAVDAGKTLVVTRTDRGEDLLRRVVETGDLVVVEPLSLPVAQSRWNKLAAVKAARAGKARE